MSNTFSEDLPIGELAEDFVADILSDYFGIILIKDPNGGKNWDLVSMCGNYSFEVKYDRKAHLTGNIALEYNYKGQPSGIKTTKATHWVYLVNGEVWIATVQSLLQFLMTFYRSFIKIKGGDDKQSSLLLIEKKDWQKVFTKIFPVV